MPLKQTLTCVSGAQHCLSNLFLRTAGIAYSSMILGRDLTVMKPHVFLLGAKHTQFQWLQLPRGSVVLDPWRYVKSAGDEVKGSSIGRGPNVSI